MSAHATVFAQHLVESDSISHIFDVLQEHIAQELAASLDHDQLKILIEKAVKEFEHRVGRDDTMALLLRITKSRDKGDTD